MKFRTIAVVLVAVFMMTCINPIVPQASEPQDQEIGPQVLSDEKV